MSTQVHYPLTPGQVLARAAVLSVILASFAWCVHAYVKDPPYWRVVRRCSGGASWLDRDQYGNLRITSADRNIDVAPENVEAACPR